MTLGADEAYHGQKWYQAHKEQHREGMRKWEKSHPYRSWAYKTRNAHKAKGYEVELTNDEVEAMAKITPICPICGIELDYSVHTKDGKIQSNSPSLDRKDGGKVLNVSNTWIVCNRCNRTKGDRTWKEFVSYCKMVAEHGDKL